ncbi:MAG: hypothetical protein ACE5FO_14020 [Parvularculaceae bacterium]
MAEAFHSQDFVDAALPDRRISDPSPPGEEELRFIRNFHDVFLSIGLLIFAAGLGIVSALVVGQYFDIDSVDGWRRAGWIYAGVSFADAAIMWALAEIFARTRRLFLPAIVILLVFVSFFLSGVFMAYVVMFSEQQFNDIEPALEQLRALPVTLAAAGTIAIAAYYLRMKLPFAMGLGALALATTGIAAYGYYEPAAFVDNIFRLQLLAGLFLFLLGLFFDARDPDRRTRLSDNGFWLHFFAAPLIFVSVTVMAVGADGAASGDAAAAGTTLAIVGSFALVSLLINRRALLVSGLISAAIAIGVLVSKTGLDGAWTAALTLLLLGGAMVLLGGGWHVARRVLVAPFPKGGPLARIIPPETGVKE